MDRERLDQWCERGILGLTLAILLFGALALGAVNHPVAWQFPVLQGLVCGVLFLWIARLWVKPSFRLLWPPICWPVMAFIGYAIVRYRYADIEYVARLELIRVFVYGVVFFAVLNNLNRQDLALALCVGVIFLAGAEALLAILQFASPAGHGWKLYADPLGRFTHRVTGTFFNPNQLAGFLEMTIPAALALVAAGRVGHAFKVVLAYLAGLMLIAEALTLSRGGFVATAVSLAALLLVLASRRNYRLPAVFFLAVLAWAGYYFASHSEDLNRRVMDLSSSGGSKDVRSELWPATWRMWLDHPWWGVGPGHYDARFEQYRPPMVQEVPQFAHNDYLNTLADWGLVGAGLVALVFVVFYRGIARTWPFVHRAGNALQAKKSNKPAILLGGAAAVLAMLVHEVSDFNLHIPADALLAVTWIALVSSYLRFATEGYWVGLRGAGKVVATCVLLLAAAYLGGQGLRRAEASRRLWQAEQAAAFAPKAQAEIQARQDLDDDRKSALENAQEAKTEQEIVGRMTEALALEPMDQDTSRALAEYLLETSARGETGYEKTVREAMGWFERGMNLNRWEPYNYTGFGRCLDLIGQSPRATAYFDHAAALAPNDAFILYRCGRHAIELGAYRKARRWLGRALLLEPFHLPPPARVLYERTLPQRIQEAETRAPHPPPAAK